MRPRQDVEATGEPLGPRLDAIVDPNHALIKLASAIDWRLLEGRFVPPQGKLRPQHTRLLIGLSILRQLYGLSEDELFQRWLENPYYQYLCGEEFFRHLMTAERSQLEGALSQLGPDKVRTLVRAGLTSTAGLSASELPEIARLGLDGAFHPRKGRRGARAARRQNNGDKPVSIYDVARHAGVSIKTVSLVMNRRPEVSLQTRAAVLAAIDELAYKPNVFARGLASERSDLIGLLYDNPPGSYIADLQQGALAKCREAGYHLVIEMLMPQQDLDLCDRVRALVSESVLHGAILTPPLCDERRVIDELTQAQTPFVRIAPGVEIADSLAISIDEYKAAYEMTSYLIGLGHRRIGFVKGKPDHWASRMRLDGYRTALAYAGISFSDELCVQGFFSYQSGIDAGERLLSLKKRPTAIFACNDDMAAGVLAVSQRFNLKVPQDLSLAGFDDSMVAQLVWPRLTTCRQPLKEMAATAVSILTQKRTHERPGGRKLDHELVVRESTAPPAA